MLRDTAASTTTHRGALLVVDRRQAVPTYCLLPLSAIGMDPTKDKNEAAKEETREEASRREEEQVPVGDLEDADADGESMESSDAMADPAATIYGGNIAAACEATNAVAKTITAEERLERRRTRNRLNARRNREIRRREEKLNEEKEGLRQMNETLRREKRALEQEVQDLREIVRQLTSTPTASHNHSWLSALSASASLPPTLNPLANPLSSQRSLLQLAPTHGLTANPLLGAQSSALHQQLSSQHGGPSGILFPPVALAEQQRLPSLTLNDAIQSSMSLAHFPARPRDAQSLIHAALHRGLDMPTTAARRGDLRPEGPTSNSAVGGVSGVSQDSKDDSVKGSPQTPKKKKARTDIGKRRAKLPPGTKKK